MGQLQELIIQSNKKSAANNKKQFARKASEQQMLDKMISAAQILLEALENGREYNNALRDLKTITVIANKRQR